MNDWGKFNNTSLPEKEDVCSHLNIEDITDVDYPQAQWLCKDFEIKDLGECHYLYVQSNTLMLADKFENFRNIFLEIYDKYMKDYNENKASSYIHHWDVDNLYCCSMLLSLNNFEWFEDTFQFNGDFIKNYNEGSGSWWRILSWRWFSASGKITWTS